ncbi:DNA polymerase Y family protein [Allofournierella massiliensis]|uniref:DNA polymerase IV n=1 Tax=Allofournierella massiliensis TaxID=1650663 RepID=A0A4R1R5L9_9FIRM|nr:DNA polymerase IV [Fournierella massiliensis]TCL60768.1 DNA polymerase-4 [Fournierella massiliensis]
MERWIFHCDCNSFYASVELLRHPELRDKCVAVCGDPEGRHGIVLAKNEPAKRMGVKTAEVIWQAKRKCPDLVLLPPHREYYRKYSKIINEIYRKYTDRVEPFGIDESWLDVTGTWQLFAESPAALADRLRAEVKAATGLTISVGVSFNKVFAKLGSDYKKPDATTLITRENFHQIVWPLPAGDLLYVGASAQKRLAGMGISTIGELAAARPEALAEALGKLGLELSRYARGEDEAPVRRWGEKEPIKSVGNGTTFRRNIRGPAEIRSALNVLADEVAGRLRRHGVWAGAVQVTIRDPNLKTITRQKQLPMSTHLARDLANACWELMEKNWDMARPVRMLTVTALAITEEPFAVQQSLFDDAPKADPRREKLEQSLDAIRKKYGRGAIGAGSILHNDMGLGELAIRPQSEGDGEEEEFDEKVKGPL